VTPGTGVFGTTRAGQTVHRLVIADGALSAAILTRGAALQDVRLAGIGHSLTVGSPDLGAYEAGLDSCGAIVGPVANRISVAAATIAGRLCRFDRNWNGRHTLHGGGATHTRLWQPVGQGRGVAELQLSLADGDHGFPGNRTLHARFDIVPPATLRLTLTAKSDAPTLMNLANHSYWRLSDAPTFAGQTLTVDAGHYLPVTQGDLLPTGRIAPVSGTRFDYRSGRELHPGSEGLIDTNFCLCDRRVALRPVAVLSTRSGLQMQLSTTEPGLQVFDGHILNLPDHIGNDGRPYCAHAGLALEAQFWPDAPTHAHFPTILLRPGRRMAPGDNLAPLASLSLSFWLKYPRAIRFHLCTGSGSVRGVEGRQT